MSISNISFKSISNWWNSVPNELDNSIQAVFAGKAGESMRDHIRMNASDYVQRAKLEGKAIMIHPQNALLRSLVVTPQGDFFLLLNRHKTEGDEILGGGASKQASLAIHLNTGEKYASLRSCNITEEDANSIGTELVNNAALQSAKGCTHITHVVEYTSVSGKYRDLDKVRFFIPLCNQGSLDKAIKTPLSEAEKISIIKDLSAALHEMHELKIIHRDIKPGNALLHNGKAFLTDFDTSGKFYHIGNFKQQEVIGTPPYLPPEVFLSEKGPRQAGRQGGQGDVYGLGITFLNLYGVQIEGDFLSRGQAYYEDVLQAAHALGDQPQFKLIQKMVALNPKERICSRELDQEAQAL